MASIVSNRITPCLWFDGNGEDAAKFYTALFPNSGIGSIMRWGEGGHAPAGTALTVEFKLDGMEFLALNGGPQFKFTEAVSFQVFCKDQAEVDHYWDRLSEGGETSVCSWLKDKFGLSWQIVPAMMPEIFRSGDQKKIDRVMQAMMQMTKLDIATLEKAAKG
ncbi:MAG: VOC family protein [Proteobacteria bacterium]|nr:VOC family protein [Pseudomonadota bacterium]